MAVDDLIEKVIDCFSNIDVRFEKAGDIRKQRHMVCSMFPEKLTFDGERYGTPKVNLVAEAIWLINNELPTKEEGKEPSFDELSLMVARRGSFSNPFLQDLRMLAA